MSQTYRLKRFTNVGILKQIHLPLLIEFFQSDDTFRNFLTQRGLNITAEEEQFDYAMLAKILMSPDVNTPEELLDALYFVDSLAGSEHYERMLEECRARNIDLPGDEISAEDLALRLWLADRKVLESIHAEQYRVKPKKFESYFATMGSVPDRIDLSESALSALEEDLNEWFATHKKGRGTRVFPFLKEEGIWFLVRHGEHIKRQGTMDKHGDSGRVFFRPEKFDVLIYYPDKGELAIYTDTKGQRQIYCRCFGQHLFGDPDFFQFDSPLAKYTLAPIIDDGPEVLVCSDVIGLKSIRLYELQFSRKGQTNNRWTIRANNVFSVLSTSGPNLFTESGRIVLLRAKFKVTFGCGKERTVVIQPPNIAAFDREADNEVIHEWLAKRGFICTLNDQEPDDVAADDLLAVP